MFEDAFNDACEKGDDVVCITMSSALSGTYNNAVLAADSVRDDYPDREIFVIDSLQASVGIIIQALYAAELVRFGNSAAQITEAVIKMQNRVRIMALLDTLEYVKKGGRISGAAAAIGGLLSIKPVVSIDEYGK